MGPGKVKHLEESAFVVVGSCLNLFESKGIGLIIGLK
jgi:hypothetical protein